MPTYIVPADGPLIATERDGSDVIGDAMSHDADLVVIPAARLSPVFFRLSTGLAGAILQKFSNYRIKVAIVGDIAEYTSISGPLRDFVAESNRHGQTRFLASLDDL